MSNVINLAVYRREKLRKKMSHVMAEALKKTQDACKGDKK